MKKWESLFMTLTFDFFFSVEVALQKENLGAPTPGPEMQWL